MNGYLKLYLPVERLGKTLISSWCPLEVAGLYITPGSMESEISVLSMIEGLTSLIEKVLNPNSFSNISSLTILRAKENL